METASKCERLLGIQQMREKTARTVDFFFYLYKAVFASAFFERASQE